MLKLAAILTLLITAFHLNARALGFEDVAGTYVGKRTTYGLDGNVTRNDEIDVIDSDGMVYNYLYVKGELIYTSGGQLHIDDQGRFFFVSNNITIELHGNHLEVTALWPDAVVHVLSHWADQPAHWLR